MLAQHSIISGPSST